MNNYKIRLEIFEGPLDLLLYLIKKEELNIYDIPITRITEQYLEYLNLMPPLPDWSPAATDCEAIVQSGGGVQTPDLDIAGEFLLMAATLMQIKSRMLLPPDPEAPAEEEDPRAQLVRRLLEYKAFKEAAQSLRVLEERRSGVFGRSGVEAAGVGAISEVPLEEVSLFDLLSAFTMVLKRLPKGNIHEVVKDEYSVAEKIQEIFERLAERPVVLFGELFRRARHRLEAITIFLALLELVRLKEIEVRQPNPFEEIEVSRAVRAAQAGANAGEVVNGR